MEDNEEAERLFKEALAALKEMRHLINTIGKPYAAKVHGKYGEFLLSIEKKEEGEKQLRAAAKLGYGSGEVKPSPSAHNASTSQVSGSTSSAPGIPSMAFGPAEWEKYFGEVDPAPPLPADIEEILNSSCHYWPTKKVSETHLLFYVPSQVDDKPLTLNSLGHLIQNPKGGGKKTKYRYYKDDLVKAYGSKVTEAHWVLMTRDVVPGSRKNTYLKQCDLSKGGDEPLHLLDATVGILMSHTMSGKRLFGDNPWTDTRCQEVYGGYQICVGSFSLDGLSLHNDWSGGDGCGLALARKF